MPTPTESKVSKKGRKTEFGNKMNLGDVTTYRAWDQYEEKTWINSKRGEYTVQMKCWNDMLLRGSRKHHSSEHPMHLIQIILLNDQNEEVHKRPLWISVFGSRRNEIPLFDVHQSYNSRYDAELFF